MSTWTVAFFETRAVQAQREEHGGEHQERFESDAHHSSPSLVHQTAPTSAAVSSSDAISNGSAQPSTREQLLAEGGDVREPTSGSLTGGQSHPRAAKSMSAEEDARRAQRRAHEKSRGRIASSRRRSVIMIVKSMSTATATGVDQQLHERDVVGAEQEEDARRRRPTPRAARTRRARRSSRRASRAHRRRTARRTARTRDPTRC